MFAYDDRRHLFHLRETPCGYSQKVKSDPFIGNRLKRMKHSLHVSEKREVRPLRSSFSTSIDQSSLTFCMDSRKFVEFSDLNVSVAVSSPSRSHPVILFFSVNFKACFIERQFDIKNYKFNEFCLLRTLPHPLPPKPNPVYTIYIGGTPLPAHRLLHPL